MTQIVNSTLGQSTRNNKFLTLFNAPDTDSRLVIIQDGGTSVSLNLMHDHTRVMYIVPVGNTLPVTFTGITNSEDRSLHWLVVDNSNNGSAKIVTFAPQFSFNGANTYTIPAGKVAVWFGAVVDNIMYLRDSIESQI